MARPCNRRARPRCVWSKRGRQELDRRRARVCPHEARARPAPPPRSGDPSLGRPAPSPGPRPQWTPRPPLRSEVPRRPVARLSLDSSHALPRLPSVYLSHTHQFSIRFSGLFWPPASWCIKPLCTEWRAATMLRAGLVVRRDSASVAALVDPPTHRVAGLLDVFTTCWSPRLVARTARADAGARRSRRQRPSEPSGGE